MLLTNETVLIIQVCVLGSDVYIKLYVYFVCMAAMEHELADLEGEQDHLDQLVITMHPQYSMRFIWSYTFIGLPTKM